MHLHRSIASAFIIPVSPEPYPSSFLRRLLVLLIAIAMVWQGVEVARGAHPGHAATQANAEATPASGLAAHDEACDLCGETDNGECAGHMQHHATAALATPLTVDVGRPAAEHIMRGPGLMPSADANTPLRPPKTTPTVRI